MARARDIGAVVALAVGVVVITLATWPEISLGIGAGVDPSWVAGIHVAAHEGLVFGREVAYTYGPFGYLSVPRLSYLDQGFQGFAFAVAWQLALCLALLLAARRSFGWAGGVVVTIAALALVRLVADDNNDVTQIALGGTMLLAVLAALRRAESGAAGRWVLVAAVGFGVVAALTLLIKLNAGVVIVAITGIAVAALQRRRWWLPVAVWAATLVVGVATLWALAGQPFDAIDEYARTSLEIVAGHAEALQVEEAAHLWEYPGAAFVLGILATATWLSTAGWTPVRRLAVFGILAAFSFAAFKQAFIRHDLIHSLQFFVPMLLAFIAIGIPRRALAWMGAGALAGAVIASGAVPPTEVLTPRESLTAFTDAARILQRGEDAIAENRLALRGGLRLDERTQELLRGRTVHVAPLEASTAWAFPEFEWRPVPVFQAYVAHTPALDDLNAETLDVDARAPERILRTAEYNPFENPKTVLTMLCNYREIHTGSGWQVLARVPNRCGSELRPLKTVTTTTSEGGVTIPDPPSDDQIVIMRLRGLEYTPRERVRSLLLKPYNRVATFDGEERIRYLQELFERGVVARVPEEHDYSGTFRLTFPADVIGLSLTRQIQYESEFEILPFTIEFLTLSIREPGTLDES